MGLVVIMMILGLTLIAISIYMVTNIRNKNTIQNQSIVNVNNLNPDYGIVHFTLDYLGGHPRMKGIGAVKITASKDSLIWTGNGSISIDLNTLKSVEMKTESEITKDVTLTRLLMTGIFALAWQKKTTINNMYLIFNFKEYDVPYTAIFRADNKYKQAQVPISSIVNITNRNLIELNKKKSKNELII